MRLSEKSMAIEPSLTRQLFNLAHQYEDVIDLTLGDPDIMPEEGIRKAAAAAIMDGKTRYSANAGLFEVRSEIAKMFSDEYKLKLDPSTNLLMTVGGMEALFLALAAVINDGDEVIIQAPYYVNYVQMVRMCGGIPVLIETTEEDNFSFTAADVRKRITSHTVAMILNTPCNPTGQVLSGSLLDELADLFIQKDILVITDEVYRTLIYKGVHESIITRPGMLERTVLVDSLSKRFAMTGYRVGFAAGSEKWIAAMVKMQENVAACAPLPSQYAALEAYREYRNDTTICAVFSERARTVESILNKSSVIHCIPYVATFYLFVNIQKTGMKSLDFAYRLLEKEHVAVAPGVAYGRAYDSYIRIACTLDKDKLVSAAYKILNFVDLLGVEL